MIGDQRWLRHVTGCEVPLSNGTAAVSKAVAAGRQRAFRIKELEERLRGLQNVHSLLFSTPPRRPNTVSRVKQCVDSLVT